MNELCELRALKDTIIDAIDARDSLICNIFYNESRALIIKDTFANRDAFVNRVIKDTKRSNNNKYNKDYYNLTKDILYLIDIKRAKYNINRGELKEESMRLFELRGFRRSRAYKILRAF